MTYAFDPHDPRDYLAHRRGQIVELTEDPDKFPTSESPMIGVKFPDGYTDAAFRTELHPVKDS